LVLPVEPLEHSHHVGNYVSELLFEKPQKDSSKELSDAEAASGQNGIDFITAFALG
jgi:hypothetical protein